MDATQYLCDWHPGDRQVERHKQREDWCKPVGGEREKSRGLRFGLPCGNENCLIAELSQVIKVKKSTFVLVMLHVRYNKSYLQS